jgi:4-amino-4-deoxy-L-arabinose transferase-like glycosyltransferase
MKLVSRIHSGYLFLFSFLLVFVATPLFQKGVFGDGLMYLTVAFNRFKGYGSFWKQHYTNTSMSFFCEQPPLYFESLGGFYRLFGGAEVAEKIFTLLLVLLTVILSIAIWNKVTNKKLNKIEWLPALLVFCVAIFTWTFCNQVIETMVVPLSLFVFYLQLVFVTSKNLNKRLLAFLGMAAGILLLLLTKGVQSTFLIAALFFAALTVRRDRWWRTSVSGLLLIVIVISLCGALFLQNENALFWLKSYFDKRLVATFNDTGATARHNIDIIVRYFSELLPVIGVLVLISVWLVMKKKYSWSLQWRNFRQNRNAQWLLLISLSASVPLAVTLEQRGFYLSPSFPFAVLALCVFYGRYLFLALGTFTRRKQKPLAVAGSVFLVGSIVFFVLNKDGYKRDEGMILDVDKITALVKKGDVIGINSSTWNTFSLHSYLNKANDNSLAVTDTLEYFIQERSNTERVSAHYKKIELQTEDVDVYRRRTMPPR